MGMRDPSCVLRLLLAVPALLHCFFCFTNPRGMASKTVATLSSALAVGCSNNTGCGRVGWMDEMGGWVGKVSLVGRVDQIINEHCFRYRSSVLVMICSLSLSLCPPR